MFAAMQGVSISDLRSARAQFFCGLDNAIWDCRCLQSVCRGLCVLLSIPLPLPCCYSGVYVYVKDAAHARLIVCRVCRFSWKMSMQMRNLDSGALEL